MSNRSNSGSKPGRWLAAMCGSPGFWLIIGIFVLEAAWIALSGRYPMAFDEDFHLGIIRIYAHHINPFFGSQPPNSDMYGAVARDPSYLYHYLMSFPYRLISLFTSDQTIQVIWLRFINIGLFASGLILFRRVLRLSGASGSIINLAYAGFILIPVVPLLAAQINYDNLLLPLVALCWWLTLRLAQRISKQQPLDFRLIASLISLCLLTSLVKYAFLPIFLAIVIYLLVRGRRGYGSWRKFGQNFVSGVTLVSRPLRWLLALAVVLSLALFSQRYVINIVHYHTPIPDCGKVLNVEACSDYGPWIRDYNLSLNKSDPPSSPLIFANDWFYGMWLRLFFSVDGPTTNFQTRGPLLVPGLTGIVLPIASVALLIIYGRRLWRRYDREWLNLALIISGVYLVALWLDEYRSFLRTGQAVAINGRYLLPVLLPLLVLAILAWNQWLGQRRWLKLAVACAALLCLAWGGGTLTYILRSNNGWYWPNQTVQTVNQAVRNTLGPLVPGDKKPTEFMH